MKYKPWKDLTGDEKVVVKEIQRARWVNDDPELNIARKWFTEESKKKARINRHVNKILELRAS